MPWSDPMADQEELTPDRASLHIPGSAGALRQTGDPWEPIQLPDPTGAVIQPVRDYLKDLQAAGRATATQRSYAMDLLRWFRFSWALGVPWDQATRTEARDFSRWLQIADKPVRRHWRSQGDDPPAPRSAVVRGRAPNPVTGKAPMGPKYAAATRAHSESVLRRFYDLHLEAGTGPIVNPFPLARGEHSGRPGAHHNPMDPYEHHRSGLFRPRLATAHPRRQVQRAVLKAVLPP